MQTEIEAKWLDVSPDKIRSDLKRNGAQLIAPERIMVRRNFDFPDGRLENVGGWVRVRNEGDKVTLSYKQLNDRTIHGTQEITIIVNDFDTTCGFLEAIGLQQTSFQETRRESWRLGDTEIEIDTWPWIPTFVEIEAINEEMLFDVAMLLGLPREKALHGSVEVAYQAVYDVSEAEIDGWEDIRFNDTPSWLRAKAKKI